MEDRARVEIRRVAEEEKLPIHLAALDVDDDASVREAFARVVAQLGPIDVLVNNDRVALLASCLR